MTNFNKTLTKTEAVELCNAKDGMSYPSTVHNKKMIASVLRDVVMNLDRSCFGM